MDKFDIYRDISERTGGDIYLGVVGPVRTGKSTFITKFMEAFVMPNIGNKLQRQIATDEMPQSADGKTVMTTQPKFVPANGVKVQFKNKATANVRLVDCVGYLVDGVNGHEEDGKPRLVKTPWSDEDIPFEKAAEIGTRKVIRDYSTIGIMVTTDGSISEISRENYIAAEERTVKELKECGKPFIVFLNCKNPKSETAQSLASNLEEKYGVSVVCGNALELNAASIGEIMEKVLMEFPMSGFNLRLPKWMQALPADNKLIEKLVSSVKKASADMCKMKDYPVLNGFLSDSEDFNGIELDELQLGCGVSDYKLAAKEGLFYKVLSDECGEDIKDEYELMGYVKAFSESKKRFGKIKDALDEAENGGYGVVMPTIDEMNLDEPSLIKQGGKYGVKIKASAPSLHIMKIDVSTEVSPIVGNEKQGEDFVKYLKEKFEQDPSELWDTNMFGKSLHDMVSDGLSDKLTAMPKEAQGKMRKTVTRIVNENKGGLICILL